MAFDVTKLKPDNAKAIVIIIVVVAVLVFGLYYVNKTLGGFGNLFSSIEEKLGIKDSPEEAALKKQISDATSASASPGSPWSPQYFQNAPNGASLFTQDYGDTVAKAFWDSVSWWFGAQDDQLVAAIKLISTKSQLSFVAWRFQQNYGKDLYTWITTSFSSRLGGPRASLSTVNSYVATLPNYN